MSLVKSVGKQKVNVDFNKDFTSGMDFSDIYQNPDLVGWME